MSDDEIEKQLGSIIQSNHYIRHRVQHTVNQFLRLRLNLLEQLKSKDLNNINEEFAPLINAMNVETLNQQVTSDKVQLALCGENSSGKTSFIHLLLRIGDILPADIGPITARIVKMAYAPAKQACALVYPSLEASFTRTLEVTVDLSGFFKDEDKPDWKGISKALEKHVRRPKDMKVDSDEFAVWAKHFIEIRLPSPILKLGIDVYDTAGFRFRDAQILKTCLFDLVRLVHPTIVFLYDNPSSTDETNECFREVQRTLKGLDPTNFFFLNTKADIGGIHGIKKIKTIEQFIQLAQNERIKRYNILLKTPSMANGNVGGLPKSFDKCHCFDMCSSNSEELIPFGPIMNRMAIRRLIQFVANSDLIMAQRVSSLVLPAIEAFFDLTLITSHRTKDQIKQLRNDALKWIENYFDKHRIEFDRFLREVFGSIVTRLSATENELINRAGQLAGLPNIKIFIQMIIQQEIMKGVVYDALGMLPTIVSNLIKSNENLTINVISNEILIAALREDVNEQSDQFDRNEGNRSILKCFMRETFTTPALMITDLLFNEENNEKRIHLLSSTQSPSLPSIPYHDAKQYLNEIHHHIKTSETMYSTTISKWCSRLKDKLKQRIDQQYNAAVHLIPFRDRIHSVLQLYVHQFVQIECQLQAAQDLAKFNGKKPIIRTSKRRKSDSVNTVYRLEEIEWDSINEHLFVKRLVHPITNQPYTSYLEAHYHHKITHLNLPNLIPLTYLYENYLSNNSYELWMIFETSLLTNRRTLNDLIDEYQSKKMTITLKKNFQILLPIIDALTSLHENELVHQNITLNNILFDEDNQSYLADFGDWILTEQDPGKDPKLRHFMCANCEGAQKDMKDFGRVCFFLCAIIDPEDLSSTYFPEYKHILEVCVTQLPKAAKVRQDFRYLYDKLNGISK